MTGADAPVRVLSIPPRHAYVDAVRPAGVAPVRPDRVSGWEPDPCLVADGVSSWASEADVVHLHFGYEHLSEQQLRAWLVALARHDLPLVVTVHDLRNPHHRSPAAHDAALRLLVPAAAAVLTLTPGAGADVRERYGRTAVVVPHPAVADPDRTADVTPEPGLVLLALKSLRTNVIEPVRLARAAAVGAARGGGRLRVDLHPDVVGDPRLSGLDTLTDVEVAVHERYDDLELERLVRRAHATVLPYRWGTHSGWLELARDLGTRVVAPSCGHYAEQAPGVVTYDHDEEHGLDEDSLAEAVHRAVTQAPPPVDRDGRQRVDDSVRHRHTLVYADALRAARSTT